MVARRVLAPKIFVRFKKRELIMKDIYQAHQVIKRVTKLFMASVECQMTCGDGTGREPEVHFPSCPLYLGAKKVV